MKLLVQLSALCALSFAFIIPQHIPDGVYMHSLHENGSRMFTSLDVAIDQDAVSHTLPSAKFWKHRDLPFPAKTAATICGNGDKVMYYLKRSDVVAAMTHFHRRCDPKIDPHLIAGVYDVFARVGTAVVFMCNYGGQWCKNDEFDEAFNMVKKECGDHSGQNTGYVTIDAWYKSYGFDYARNNICR